MWLKCIMIRVESRMVTNMITGSHPAGCEPFIPDGTPPLSVCIPPCPPVITCVYIGGTDPSLKRDLNFWKIGKYGEPTSEKFYHGQTKSVL